MYGSAPSGYLRLLDFSGPGVDDTAVVVLRWLVDLVAGAILEWSGMVVRVLRDGREIWLVRFVCFFLDLWICDFVLLGLSALNRDEEEPRD